MSLHRFGVLVLLSCFFLSACGFHLRGGNQDPQRTLSVAIVSEDLGTYAPLRKAAQSRMKRAGFLLLKGQAADFVIQELSESWDTQTLSIDRSLEISTYILHYQLHFQIRDTHKKTVSKTKTVFISRDLERYTDDLNAHNSERELLERLMREEALEQLMGHIEHAVAS